MLPLLLVAVLAASDRAWQPAPDHLMTRWGATIDPAHVHASYPRPTMARRAWQNLNGVWEFEPADAGADETPPVGRTLGGTILVPFPVESALSGVGRHHERMWYRRRFEAPSEWRSGRVVLHLDAVDWSTVVWINGIEVGRHQGGYDRISLDITDALREGRDQELIVWVEDPTDRGTQPRGKQVLEPSGIWYTPSSGIWQTVWIEPLPVHGVRDVRIDAALADGSVRIDLPGATLPDGGRAELVVREGDATVAQAATTTGHATVRVPTPRPWTPDTPAMYALDVRILDDAGTVVDEVECPFAFRTIGIRRGDDGVPRVALNGSPVFLVGPLDQGFWPDGLYSPPSDEAMRFDIESMKRLGFNAVRKHVKVEPERWYHLCDTLGLLVLQDMPSGDRSIGPNDPDIVRSAESDAQFRRELRRLVEDRGRHPSVIAWVVFNEGWGQSDTLGMTDFTKALDPTRPVISASGWTDRGTGDIKDHHVYPGPGPLPIDLGRATFLGEFGGLGLGVDGHTWNAKSWGYRGASDQADLTNQYVGLLERLWRYRDAGLSGGIYTQLTDVETECNGLFTYDRAVLKVDADRVAKANRGRFPSLRSLTVPSDGPPARWRYLEGEAPAGWTQPDFDDRSWRQGPGGFGRAGTPGATIGTEWTSPRIALRRQFDLNSLPATWRVRIHHDEDARVYLNGALVAELSGYTTEPVVIEPGSEATGALRIGTNILAVECRQTTGGQFIDADLVEVVPVSD
ncbi:MAG: hypothetical protein KDA22_12610 [Phycisphaerales bacterium]|nr:hypothetical protein [Phycisphaerales bacterium]